MVWDTAISIKNPATPNAGPGQTCDRGIPGLAVFIKRPQARADWRVPQFYNLPLDRSEADLQKAWSIKKAPLFAQTPGRNVLNLNWDQLP
jgi:hypothetical protein